MPGRRVRSYRRVCYSPAAPNPLRAMAIASGAEAERVLQKLGAQSTQHWPNRRPQGWAMRSRSSIAVRAAHARFQVPAGDHVGSAAAELVDAPRPAPQGGEQKALEPPPPPAHPARTRTRGPLGRPSAAPAPTLDRPSTIAGTEALGPTRALPGRDPGGGSPQAGDHGTNRVAGPRYREKPPDQN